MTRRGEEKTNRHGTDEKKEISAGKNVALSATRAVVGADSIDDA